MRQAITALLLSLAASAAMAHADIKQSVPAQGAVLKAPIQEVSITFNEKVEAMFTSATLSTDIGVAVQTGKAALDPANPTILRMAVPVLASGKYVIKWNAVGHDGHRRTGMIRFSVR